ncbi:serine hydrolase domain-containing protein [Sorangium sp. So ce269]
MVIMHRIRPAVAIGAALSLYSGAALAVVPLPTTGMAWSGFSTLDTAVQNWASTNNVKAITVAVVRDKKLVYEKGYGYQDSGQTQEILPDARMRLATNSVNLTRRALRTLIEEGTLNPESFVVDVLGPDIGAPINGTWGDEIRMNAIKIKHLLNDTTCLSDGSVNPDGSAIFINTFVGQNYWGAQDDIGRNATAAERIKWHWGQSTTMRPSCTVGTTMRFSHYAMEVAGQIIAMSGYDGGGFCNPNIIDTSVDDYASCTGFWYGVYISGHVAVPIGATFSQAQNLPNGAYFEEIWYDSAGSWGTWPVLGAEWDRNWTGVCSPYADCQHVPVAYSTDYFARPGSGTIVASARDVARLTSIYWPGPMSAKPTNLSGFRNTTGWGVGGGSLPGTTTLIIDGVINNALGKHPVTAVILANKQVESATLESAVKTALEGTTQWPTFDLFEDTRIKNYWNNQYMQFTGGGSVTYAALNTSSVAQRWRLLTDSEGFTRLVNAWASNGMISNQNNHANAEYLAPHSSSLGSWWSQQWTLQNTGTAGTKRFNARWWNTHRLNVENQTGSVEQSAVPDNYSSAWWSLEPVPSGATTCSTSTTSPSCLCTSTSGTTPCSCGGTACPAYWNTTTCSQTYHNANDGCDCGCGGWDPDCDKPGQTLYCNGSTGTTCSRNTIQCE